LLHGRMLRYLDVVARVGTIRKAAAQLHIASSAINRQIIALEEELGEPLFERMPRRMRLTAAGEVLIQHVRETLRAHEQTMQQIEAMKGLTVAPLTEPRLRGLAFWILNKVLSWRQDRDREHLLYSERELNKIARMRNLHEIKAARERAKRDRDRAIKEQKLAARERARKERELVVKAMKAAAKEQRRT